MAAAESSQFWSFDVSALMVLIGEGEEQKYRLARRSFLESVVAAPVSGLQAYLRSYEFLLDLGSFEYFSPYGCKKAPLRNMKLENAIKKEKLLEDQQYTCFRIPASIKASQDSSRSSKDKYLLWCWVLTTWIVFVGIIIFCVLAPWTTWIGLTICLALYTWSLILRLIEWAMVIPAFRGASDISDASAVDAIFILGRDSSGFVLEGSRQDIKNWTSRGLVYRDYLWSFIPLRYCQWFTRIGTMALLLFIFITIPNGSTTDQVAFIVLNILGQLNTLVGIRLNARSCISRLEIAQHDVNVRTRTNLYGSLIRKFKDVPDQTWIDKANLTPETPLWVKWKEEIIKDIKKDPKQLYNELCKDQSK
ncbi:hypothetical protein LT330_006145 [Penicillium expansum]|nr:hypothetical protein LT330_006145 [Penicillium expansum]